MRKIHFAGASRALRARLRPLTAGGLLLASIPGCSARDATIEDRDVLLTPQSTVLLPTPAPDTVTAFRWEADPPGDTLRPPIPLAHTELIERRLVDRGDSLLLHIINVPSRQWSDTLLVRLRDLAPIWEHARLRGQNIRVDYDGSRVRWRRTHGDSLITAGDSAYASPVFAFNQLEMIVRSMPLRVGYTAVIPMYSEGTPEMELDTLTVVSAPDSNDPGEPAWTLRFADSHIVSTYRLSPSTREVLGVEVMLRQTGTRFTRVADPRL